MTTSALEEPPESFAPARPDSDVPGPLTGILELGRDAQRTGWTGGMVLATALHGLVALIGLASLFELRDFATSVQTAARARFDLTVDVAVDEPEPEPDPEPPPPPPAPEVAPPPSDEPLPEEAPAPAAAEAAEVLTAEPAPDEPLDLTADTMISGTGTRFAGGVTAADGTAQTAVRKATATAQGVVGGRGTGPAPPPPPKDASQPAGLIPGEDWNDCPFPPEADAEQQNHAMVRLMIVVGVDGRPSSVSVLTDPGYGFGQAARKCALRKRYTPGRDAQGKPVSKATPPVGVRFRR
jgi:protein TonB